MTLVMQKITLAFEKYAICKILMRGTGLVLGANRELTGSV